MWSVFIGAARDIILPDELPGHVLVLHGGRRVIVRDRSASTRRDHLFPDTVHLVLTLN